MKHIVKIMALLVVLLAIWISLLQISVIPKSYTWLVSFPLVLLIVLFTCTCFRSLTYSCYWAAYLYFLSKLPLYFIVTLGCYGLFMVGIGLMQFPSCPQEAILLQQDILEAKDFLKTKGVDVGSD